MIIIFLKNGIPEMQKNVLSMKPLNLYLKINGNSPFLLNPYSTELELHKEAQGGTLKYTIALKMAARNFLPICTAFYNRIPMDSLKISASNIRHLGKKFLSAIFSIIVCPGLDSGQKL